MRLAFAATAAALMIVCVSQELAAQTGAAALGSPAFKVSADNPVGWRGDGNGRYVAADPPLTWGRTSKAVQELASQAKKPKADDKGKAMPDGIIRDWLIAGPFPIPEGKAAGDEFSADEAKIEPNEGDKLGNLQWKAVAPETSWIDFWPMYKAAVPDGKGVVAYAHAYVYSAEGKPAFLNTMLTASGRVWLNGKPVGNYPKGDGLQGGVRVPLALEKGWNRLLLRVGPALSTDWSKGVIQWHFSVAFYGGEKSEYDGKNILWSTPMPDNGPGVGSPILVGDKLFVQTEPCGLVCISAKDGKVLWGRASTFADAATPEERQKNAEAFTEIDDLTAKVKESFQAYCDAPDKFLADVRANPERPRLAAKINALMKKVDAEKYAPQSGGEAGESAPTPASDGQNVYVLYGSGVVACFDLAGNRKWTTNVDVKHTEHGYCASPLVVDGKVVIKATGYLGAVALDCKTGAVAMPMPAWKAKGLHSYSTPLAAELGGEKLVVQAFGVVSRLKDGKVVSQKFTPPYYNVGDTVSPTLEGKTICSFVLAKGPGGVRFAFQTLPDAMAEPLVMADTKECEYDVKAFPCWFSYDHCASPLLYQGLAYCLSVDGVLTVIDAAKGEVVYQRLLDLTPYMWHGLVSRAGCSGSPTLAGKYIYIWDDQGSTVVIEPGRTFKQVARNRIEQNWYRYGPERNECTISNPVFSGKQMFYRGEVNLYCVEEKGK